MKGRYPPSWLWLLALLLCLILCRAQTAAAITSSITQCVQVVFPALFPFFIISNLLLRTDFPELLARCCATIFEKCFHLPSRGAAALILSLLGGYPVGARAVTQLYLSGQLSQQEAEQLLPTCNNTGPAIFFGLAGGMLFPGLWLPLWLYLIHIGSVIITGLLLRPAAAAPPLSAARIKQLPTFELTTAIWEAFSACVRICAFILAFGVVLGLLKPLLQSLPVTLSLLVTGFVDLPNGIAALGQIDRLPLQFLLCSLFINWGGLCIHLQTRAVTQQADLDLRQHTRFKLLQSLTAGLLSLPVCFSLIGLPQYMPLPVIFLIILVFLKTKVEISLQSRYNMEKAG